MTPTDKPFVLAFGDSLTAGYGLAPAESFAARLQLLLRQRFPAAAVRNAGLFGDTTESGRARLPRLLSGLTRRPDLAIVELGANDLLRGIPAARSRANLDAIVGDFGRAGIPVLLAGFEVPRLLAAVAGHYDGIHAEVAARHRVPLAPFFPPGVLGRPGLVLADGLHPNARAIEQIAAAFLPAVLAALGDDRSEAA
ncbi:arylesterase [Sphingomonas ginkgonis]|uniref:Arylesterase n=1 Tax=Sphingomonas ginkgonis TaxID=2315330 RepID=A0A429V682_9SPHN|nr:arylesterase [Sphingomonas ginkgonis]RST29445.1 arylesterase [Sphingomonas ginkgonis]